MNPGGRRSRGREPAGPAQLGWALLVVAAALVGGLAAAALVHVSLAIAVIVSLVAGGITVLIVLRSPGRPSQLPDHEPRDAGYGGSAAQDAGYGGSAAQDAGYGGSAAQDAGYGGSAAAQDAGYGRSAAAQDADVPVPPAASPHVPAEPGGQGGGTPIRHETLVQLLPLPPQPGAAPPDAPWWDSAAGAPPQPSPGARRAPAPDLSAYLAATLIAQCPRCGAFRLDIRPAANGWDFGCQSCAHTWTWQPGTPWPPVRVMPGQRREAGPLSP